MDTKKEILRNAKLLRKSNTNRNIFINEDQTPMQQRESHLLRKELRMRRDNGEDVVIFRNAVMPREDAKVFRQDF